MSNRFLLLVLISFILLNGFSTPGSTSITGKVVNEINGQPVEGVYLYTIKGEEEALTDNKGEFKFTTWKQFPVVIAVSHRDFEDQEIKLASLKKDVKVKLKKKAF